MEDEKVDYSKGKAVILSKLKRAPRGNVELYKVTRRLNQLGYKGKHRERLLQELVDDGMVATYVGTRPATRGAKPVYLVITRAGEQYLRVTTACVWRKY